MILKRLGPDRNKILQVKKQIDKYVTNDKLSLAASILVYDKSIQNKIPISSEIKAFFFWRGQLRDLRSGGGRAHWACSAAVDLRK